MTDEIFVTLHDEKLKKKRTPINERQIQALEFAALYEECAAVDPPFPAVRFRSNIRRHR